MRDLKMVLDEIEEGAMKEWYLPSLVKRAMFWVKCIPNIHHTAVVRMTEEILQLFEYVWMEGEKEVKGLLKKRCYAILYASGIIPHYPECIMGWRIPETDVWWWVHKENRNRYVLQKQAPIFNIYTMSTDYVTQRECVFHDPQSLMDALLDIY